MHNFAIHARSSQIQETEVAQRKSSDAPKAGALTLLSYTP